MAGFTQADLDALKRAIAMGEKSVTYRDRTTLYRSIDEMTTALRLIEAELSSAATPPRPRQFLPYAKGKGI